MEQDYSGDEHQHREGRQGGQRRGGNHGRGRNQRPRNNKEWKLIEKLLEKSLDEQAKTRRWGIFFKVLTFAYLFLILIIFAGQRWGGSQPAPNEPHAALVEVTGMIAEDQLASADAIASALRRAFEAKHAKGIVLRVNSPGGSPVQSGMVFDEIRRLREKYPDKKLYAAITDMGTSGAYYIAAAADEVYADKASLIGSIGVISMGFGFTEAMEKLGVERRVFTSGDNKALLDPFLPLKELEVGHFQKVLGSVHEQFISQVKLGRGERLKSDDVFNGLLWTGEQAQELGLVDGLASPGTVAREEIGEDKIINYTLRPNPLQAFASRFGVQVVTEVIAKLSQPVFQ
jgi:protease-4